MKDRALYILDWWVIPGLRLASPCIFVLAWKGYL
jgi:hypothetical protein